jgi:hypothetical protein
MVLPLVILCPADRAIYLTGTRCRRLTAPVMQSGKEKKPQH